MGVSTGEPPAQVGSQGEWERCLSFLGLVEHGWGCHVSITPVEQPTQQCSISWHSQAGLLFPIAFVIRGGFLKARKNLRHRA